MRITLLAGAVALLSSGALAQPPVPAAGISTITGSGAATITSVQIQPPSPPARDQAPRTGTSRLRGRVVAGDTGQPLRKAFVRLSAPGLRDARSTATDASGVYEFKDLPAGRYTVTANKGSYVAVAFGETRAAEGGKTVELGDNQTLERVDFRLPKGAIITGRVVDEFGEPVADAMVAPLRQVYTPSGRRMLPMGRMDTTNDVGEFRLFGLAPGQYALTATVRNGGPGMMMGPAGQSDDHSGYAPTYYPGTADSSTAQRISVAVGQVISDLQIPLVLTQTAQLSGIVQDAGGQRITGVVVAQPAGMVMYAGPSVGQIRPDGSFTITGVPPGVYTLRANRPGPNGPGDTATAEVTVNGQDISGIQLVTVPAVTASGRIVLDGNGSSSGDIKPETIQVSFQPRLADVTPFIYSPPVRVGADFSFKADVHPGQMLVRVILPGPTWILKSVRLRGADITDSGIEIASGADLSDFEVELTTRHTEVSGLVTNAKGEPASNYTVVVFPRDRQLWKPPSRYFASARPDQSGRFKVRTLPPGDYQAVALEYVEAGAWYDADFLESVEQATTGISLGEGETRTLDLRLAEVR